MSGIKPALRYGPLVALVSVSRLLFVALAALWVRIYIRAAAGSARAAIGAGIRAGITTIAIRRVAVSGINRWRIRYDVTVLPGIPRVIHVVSVVVGNSAPPIGCVHRREHAEKPRIAPSVIGSWPEAATPISAAPVRAMPAKSAVAIAISVTRMTNVRRSAGETTYVTVCMGDASTSITTAKPC